MAAARMTELRLRANGRRRRVRLGWLLTGAVEAAYFAVVFPHARWWLLTAGVCVQLCILATVQQAGRWDVRWAQSARRVAEDFDVAGIGALVEGLAMPSEPALTAKELLSVLLPRMRASDAGHLDAEQRSLLNRFLVRGEHYRAGKVNIALTLAILLAYEQVGDAAAIPAVEQLALGYSYAAFDRDVHEAAQRCLEFVRERATEERAAATLLRAAVPGQTGDVLLRAAMTSTAEDATELLRGDGDDAA